MAMQTPAQLQEELESLSSNVNPQVIAGNLYKQQIEDRYVRAAQEASYVLLENFDSFCDGCGAGYFAIAGTLAGAVSYNDFIPGITTIEVGMLRKDYLKFESAYYAAGGVNDQRFANADTGDLRKYSQRAAVDLLPDFAPDDDVADDTPDDDTPTGLARLRSMLPGHVPDDDRDPFAEAAATLEAEDLEHVRIVRQNTSALPFTLASHAEDELSHHALLPTVQFPGYCIALHDGQVVFNTGHTPLVFGAEIAISVFDAVPDDYDAARFLFKRLAQLRKLSAALSARVPQAAAMVDEHVWNLAGSYNNRPHREVACLAPSRGKAIALKDLLPLRKLPFGPVRISAPADATTWVVDDMESQQAQVELLQADASKVILEIDRICRANGIGYFICGGTMLGYVRHGGFIPWDDDMDIGMLRADYEQFLEVAPSQLDADTFFLQTRESDPNIPYLFSKMRLKNSEYVTKYNQFRDFNKGICVDIFPFDKVPFETGGIQAAKTTMKQLARNHHKVANRQVGAMPSVEPRTLADKVAREVLTLRHERWWRHSLAKTQAAYEQEATRYNDVEELCYVASFVPTFTMVHLDDLLPYQDVEFAGMKLMAPAHPEVFLQMQYGDFMTMPLPHQQRGHGLIWWSDAQHKASDFGVEPPEHAAPEKHTNLVRAHGPAIAIVAAGIGAACALLPRLAGGACRRNR